MTALTATSFTKTTTPAGRIVYRVNGKRVPMREYLWTWYAAVEKAGCTLKFLASK